MSRYVLTATCRHDIAEIWDYLAADNPDAADRILNDLHARFRLLAKQPGIGARYPELGESIRFTVVSRYVILYQRDDESVLVLRVLHGSRDIPTIFTDEPIDP